MDFTQQAKGQTNLDQGQTQAMLGNNIYNQNNINSLANPYKLVAPNQQAYNFTEADTPNTSVQNRNLVNAVMSFNNEIYNRQVNTVQNNTNRQIDTITQQVADANAQQMSLFGQGFMDSYSSVRGLSNLTDVQTKGRQAYYDVQTKGQDSINNVATQFAQQNINTLNQMRQYDFQDRQQQSQEDTTNSNLMGEQYIKGKSTGQQTLGGKQFSLSKDMSLSNLMGSRYLDGNSTGQRTMAGNQQDFGIAQTISAQTGLMGDYSKFGTEGYNPMQMSNQLTIDGVKQRQAIENQGLGLLDMKSKLGILPGQSLIGANNQFQAPNDYTMNTYLNSLTGQGSQLALDSGRNQLARGNLALQQDQFNLNNAKELAPLQKQSMQIQLKNAQYEIDKAQGKYNPQNQLLMSAKLKNDGYQNLLAQEKAKAGSVKPEVLQQAYKEKLNAVEQYTGMYGNQQGLLYNIQTDNKSGKTVVQPVQGGIYKHGLDMKSSFSSIDADIDGELQKVKAIVGQDIITALNSNDGASMINKIYFESDDSNKVIVGLRAFEGDKPTGNYDWTEVNVSGLDPVKREALKTAIKSGTANPEQLGVATGGNTDNQMLGLENLKKVFKEFGEKNPGSINEGGINPSNIMNVIGSGEYKKSGDSSVFSVERNKTVQPVTNKALLGNIIAAGQYGGSEIAGNGDFLDSTKLTRYWESFDTDNGVDKSSNGSGAGVLMYNTLPKDKEFEAMNTSLINYVKAMDSKGRSDSVFSSLKPLFEGIVMNGENTGKLDDTKFMRLLEMLGN